MQKINLIHNSVGATSSLPLASNDRPTSFIQIKLVNYGQGSGDDARDYSDLCEEV